MSEIDRIYQLFTEANPAPADSTPVTERPDADAVLHDKRKPTMLTKEPRTIPPQPSPPRLFYGLVVHRSPRAAVGLDHPETDNGT